MSYKICFVCTGNACRSPFAECVMKKLLNDAGMNDYEVFSMGSLNWGKNPRDATMADVAHELGYELAGITTAMTYERLMEADLIIVFEQHHRDAITRVLDYAHWNRIVQFNRIAFGENGYVEDPYHRTYDVYRAVAKHIENGCRLLVNQWKIQPPKNMGNCK